MLMSNIWQVVIYDQLMTDSTDGDASTLTKGGTLHVHHELSEGSLQAESEGSPQAEPSEESGDEIMSQTTASSTNKHLSFK